MQTFITNQLSSYAAGSDCGDWSGLPAGCGLDRSGFFVMCLAMASIQKYLDKLFPNGVPLVNQIVLEQHLQPWDHFPVGHTLFCGREAFGYLCKQSIESYRAKAGDGPWFLELLA